LAKTVVRFRAFVLGLDRLIGRVEAVVLAILVGAMTVVTFLQVFTRYVTEDPLIWTEELARYTFVWVTLIGGAAAVRTRGHFGLDILRRFAPAFRAPLGALSTLVIFLFLALLFYTGILETRQASLQISHALGVTMNWAYLAIPVGAGFALWHVIAHWAQSGIAAHPLDREIERTRTYEPAVSSTEKAV
jgi:TRAP-type C4-dicarboxylate transport system permease small subunit